MISVTLYEYGEFVKIPTNYVAGLKAYLKKVWQERPQYSEEKQNDQRFIQFVDNNIRARNYTGFIQFEDLNINLYPKVCKSNTTKGNILNHVLHWLSFSERIKFPFHKNVIGLQDSDDWLEVLISIFGKITNEVLASSPYQSYQEVTEETNYLKGRLAINQYISTNIITGKWSSFHCTYDPFIFDNLFNRIVKSVAKCLVSKTNNADTKNNLNQILFILEEVSDDYFQSFDCDKVNLNPLFQELLNVLDFCRMFLNMQSISETSSIRSNFCLLLPMEVIFEDYIFALIKKHLPHEMPLAQRGKFLAKNKIGKDVFKMKPDILLTQRKTVIDTKYKIRNRSLDNKKGISEADLYQMIVYISQHHYKDGILIYPSDGSEAKDEFELKNSSFTVSALDFPIFDKESLLIVEDLNPLLCN